MNVGILAFGSVIDDPGAEIAPHIARRIEGVQTPFRIEFARQSSSTRDDAPTLVTVADGGVAVAATVLVLDKDVDLELARDMLYRRERWRIAEAITAEGVNWIATLQDVWDLRACVYTALEANINRARRTGSPNWQCPARKPRQASGDMTASHTSRTRRPRGLATPLMPAYEAEVLRRTGATDLEDAWTRIRAGLVA